MFQKIIHFVKYNNAFSIAFALIFLGASVSLAASPEVRGTFISSEEIIRSVDNSFILEIDLSSFDFNLQIQTVTEDEENYYVTYTYKTISIDDYVWREILKEETLIVSKTALEEHYLKDLGLYASKEISDILNSELQYLTRTQTLEKENGLSVKVVTTQYAGLIGKHFNSKDKTFLGYATVVASQEKEEGKPKLSLEEERERIRVVLDERKRLTQEEETLTSPTPTPTSTTAPIITINGNNPANINVGVNYVDLGATATDDKDKNLGITASVNGGVPNVIGNITLNTASSTTYTITYSVTDTDGNTTTIDRIVIVGAPIEIVEEIVDPLVQTGEISTSTPEIIPEPEP